mmetsp:Transcript_14829/g.37668  ORF Transcript_14829/g.37668 Transcript_14829/m.37668 type:complete len:257 (-) Transcript_14829:316-1086(-)
MGQAESTLTQYDVEELQEACNYRCRGLGTPHPRNTHTYIHTNVHIITTYGGSAEQCQPKRPGEVPRVVRSGVTSGAQEGKPDPAVRGVRAQRGHQIPIPNARGAAHVGVEQRDAELYVHQVFHEEAERGPGKEADAGQEKEAGGREEVRAAGARDEAAAVRQALGAHRVVHGEVPGAGARADSSGEGAGGPEELGRGADAAAQGQRCAQEHHGVDSEPGQGEHRAPPQRRDEPLRGGGRGAGLPAARHGLHHRRGG